MVGTRVVASWGSGERDESCYPLIENERSWSAGGMRQPGSHQLARRVTTEKNYQNAFVLTDLANFQVGGRRVPLPACELASIRLRAECLV